MEMYIFPQKKAAKFTHQTDNNGFLWGGRKGTGVRGSKKTLALSAMFNFLQGECIYVLFIQLNNNNKLNVQVVFSAALP